MLATAHLADINGFEGINSSIVKFRLVLGVLLMILRVKGKSATA
jgi:hypothetical protein